MTEFKMGDIVFVKEKEKPIPYADREIHRTHKEFFGKVTEIDTTKSKPIIGVTFGKGYYSYLWYYYPEELGLASELKNMTLEEFSNKFGVTVNATYKEEQ